MKKQGADLTELVKTHIQSLDVYAEVILLYPNEGDFNKDVLVYVLTPEKVDLGLEQKYMDARYKVELKSGQSLSLYLYSKSNWHKQFKDTPIYHQVSTQGVHL